MKLFLTLIITIILYTSMSYYGVNSFVIWIILGFLWSLIDYLSYRKPFSWKDYVILVIVTSMLEISTWFDYFGQL